MSRVRKENSSRARFVCPTQDRKSGFHTNEAHFKRSMDVRGAVENNDEYEQLGRVTDIAPLAVFLASDESAWITGEVIRAAGGLVVAT